MSERNYELETMREQIEQLEDVTRASEQRLTRAM